MFCRQVLHRFNLYVSALHRGRPAATKQIRLNPDGKEMRAESALPGTHGIEVTIIQLLAQIDILIDQALRCVCVHVNYDRPAMYREWIVYCRCGFRRISHSRFRFVSLNRLAVTRDLDRGDAKGQPCVAYYCATHSRKLPQFALLIWIQGHLESYGGVAIECKRVGEKSGARYEFFSK